MPATLNLTIVDAAKRIAKGENIGIAVVDVSTAFLHADMDQEVFVKLDEETLKLIKEENIPGLQPMDENGYYRAEKAMYGHRKAPKLWKEHLTKILEELGLKQSKVDSSFFCDKPERIWVHVDDMVLSGNFVPVPCNAPWS